MKKILIGTHNKGKFNEIAYLIRKRIKKISPEKFKIKAPKETGKTFKQNAELKANYFAKFVNMTVISDDSGLCINALRGKPGILSARLAKRKGGFHKAMSYILKKMKNQKKRSALFVCSLSIKIPGKKVVTVIGKLEGKIAYQILGNKGFGYDSIFIPKGKSLTFGQMSKAKKIKIDHRFIAFQKLKKKIKIL